MDIYKFNLNTYKYPPLQTCTIHELTQLYEERLHLYRIMDSANLIFKPNTAKWEEYIKHNIIENKLSTYIILLKDEEYCVGLIQARRNNHIAHWLLSLCYCRNSVSREFFMCCELYWFVMLYKRMKEKSLEEFLAQNDFNFTLVRQEEKELLKDKLIKCRNIKEITFNKVCYYKTKFNEVANLVLVRAVFLYRGLAYFPKTDILFCVKNRLWNQFSKQLHWTNIMYPTNIKEDRIKDFLTNVPVYMPTYRAFSDKKYPICLENINEAAEMHYPLCMRTIHNVLKREHHLKYDCKMQYGIFLKCLNLAYEDAMTFWKTEFTKKMNEDFFDRKYAYLFKHQYGKVGARLQYAPYTCDRIINSCPQPGQHHGCPFKHWDVSKLLQTCQEDGLKSNDVNDIKDLVANNKFKEACSLYFCVRHQVITGEVVNSPNEYFDKSYDVESSLDEYIDTIFDNCETERDV